MILPTNDGHPVKRVNYATEVTHDQANRIQENHPETALAWVPEGSVGAGREDRNRQGGQGARIDARFARQDRTLAVHTWMLGIIVITVLVPTLQTFIVT